MEADRGGQIVEVIDLDGSESVSEGGDPVSSEVRRSGMAAPLLLVGAVALVGWLIVAGGSGPADNGSRPGGPSTSGLPVVQPQPTWPSNQQADPISGQVPAFRAVLTSPSGDGARLVSPLGAGGYLIENLPPLSDYAFDASGRWLAGLDTGSLTPWQQTLWVGPPEGPLEPVAIGIRSFAWHDTEPGVIGWSLAGGGEVVVTSLDRFGQQDLITVPTEGRLRGLGDWGLAIETSPRDFATAIIDPDGQVVAELPGRYRGRLAGGDLLLGGGAGPPLRYSTATGETSEMDWMGVDDDLWAVVSPVGAGVTIVVVTRDGNLARPVRAEVVRIDDGRATIEAYLDALSPVGMSADGSILVAEQASDHFDRPPMLRIIGEVDHPGLTLPDVFPGVEWVAAMAVG